MFDPCEKERREYNQALEEELQAKELIDMPLQPLGVDTPQPSNLDAIRNFRVKEEKRKLKEQELSDCEKRLK